MPAEPEFAIHNEDCIPGMARRLGDGSVDLVVSSIPFGALFMYSGKIDDIGNNRDGIHMLEEQFALHMQFCVAQLFRVLRPGCNCCIHIQQLIRYKNQHGDMGLRDFRGAVIRLFESHGFIPCGEVAIPKNPQAVARRLNLHSLMFITAKTDSRRIWPCAIGAIVAAIGYVVKVGIEIKNWYAERREQRIDSIILDAINWVFVNKVQPQKKESEDGKLTAEQSTAANTEAVAKVIAFANNAGIKVDPETISGRVQGVFARFKKAVGNNNQPEVLKGE